MPGLGLRQCAVALTAFALLSLTATAAETDPIDALVSYLDGLNSLSAGFTQERYDEYDALLETAQGRCDIKRPGRFRWEYTEPYLQTIVTDGASLWIYDQDLEQVTVNAMAEGGRGSPAELLGAEFAVLDRYTIVRLSDADGMAWFELTPTSPGAEFQVVDLAMRDGEVAAMRLKDNLGQTTLLRFANVARNQPVADDLFRFTPPPGVDVIEGGAP